MLPRYNPTAIILGHILDCHIKKMNPVKVINALATLLSNTAVYSPSRALKKNSQ